MADAGSMIVGFGLFALIAFAMWRARAPGDAAAPRRVYFRETPVARPASSTQTPPKFCVECGTAAAEGPFCAGCGRALTGVARSSAAVGASRSPDKFVATMLALFLGWLGIHKFYLGRNGAGLAYLLFFWTFIPALIALIDFLVLALMAPDDFARTYGGRA